MGADPVCAVISVLVSDHKYGTPLPKDEVVNRAAVEHAGDAKEGFEVVKKKSFIRYNPTRGMMIDNSRFGELADFLYYRCDWPKYAIKSRLRHYEGWDTHEWH